MVTVL